MISSAGNALVAFLVARAASEVSLGAFSVAFALYSLVLGVSRALVSEPMALQHHAGAVEHGAGAMSAAGILGVLTFAVTAVLCLGLSISAAVAGPVLLVAASLPLLLVQDAARMIWLVNDKPLGAVANDLAWLVAAVVSLHVMDLASRSASMAVAGWAAPGAVAGAAALSAHRSHLSIGAGTKWLKDHRSMYSALVSEQALMAASRPLVLWASGAFAGLAVPAALQAVQVMFGPVIALQVAVPFIAYLEAVRAFHRGDSVLRVGIVVSACGIGITILWFAALSFAPEPLLSGLFGVGYALANPIVVPTAVMLAATSVNLGSITVLRGLGALRSSVRVRVASAMVFVGFGLGGAVRGAPADVAWALAIATSLAVPMWCWAAVREHRSATEHVRA